MRMQLVKVVDYLRSEIEDIRFSKTSLEVTMAALEQIQARHSEPAVPGGPRTEPLTQAEIQEYLRLKREQESPGLSFFEGSHRGFSDDNRSDITMGAGEASVGPVNAGLDVEMELSGLAPGAGNDCPSPLEEPGSRTNDENADDDSDTDISSQGLTVVLASEPHLDDASEELGSEDSYTSMSSTGFSLEPASESQPVSSPPAPAPAVRAPRFRGPVKFPSRENPMPYCIGPHPSLSRSPSLIASEPYPVLPGPSVERRTSDSPVVATSPIPMPTRGYISQAPRTPSARVDSGTDILDLTI